MAQLRHIALQIVRADRRKSPTERFDRTAARRNSSTSTVRFVCRKNCCDQRTFLSLSLSIDTWSRPVNISANSTNDETKKTVSDKRLSRSAVTKSCSSYFRFVSTAKVRREFFRSALRRKRKTEQPMQFSARETGKLRTTEHSSDRTSNTTSKRTIELSQKNDELRFFSRRNSESSLLGRAGRTKSAWKSFSCPRRSSSSAGESVSRLRRSGHFVQQKSLVRVVEHRTERRNQILQR